MGKKRLLVVGAHSADFVWRAGGTIALFTSQGGEASVIALSYGERGESGELWKDPNQTIENVKRIRHEEASAAAETVGATFRGLDLGDYPLTITDSGHGTTGGAIPGMAAGCCSDPYACGSIQPRSSRQPARPCKERVSSLPARAYRAPLSGSFRPTSISSSRTSRSCASSIQILLSISRQSWNKNEKRWSA